jgi:hypothetical protein
MASLAFLYFGFDERRCMSNPADKNDDGLKRMNEALKAALKTPPRQHKDEPKRRVKEKRQPESSQ